jgi:hypothetical protein
MPSRPPTTTSNGTRRATLDRTVAALLLDDPLQHNERMIDGQEQN